MFDGMFVVSYDCLWWGCLWLIALKCLVTCCGCGGLSGLVIRVWKMGKACSNLCMYIYIYISGWWFQTFFIFHNIWDNPSHWLSYFSEGLKPPTSIYTALLEGDQRPDHLGNMDLWINWIQSLWSCFFPTKIACLLSLQYCYLLKFVKLMLEFFKQPL